MEGITMDIELIKKNIEERRKVNYLGFTSETNGSYLVLAKYFERTHILCDFNHKNSNW